MISRRQFINTILLASGTARLARADRGSGRFGELRADPEGILDLPDGFSYTIVSRAGEEMDDGLLVPARADGMAAFPAPDGRITLICNHENLPLGQGAFGPAGERIDRIPADKVYDRGAGVTPGLGGTTTMLYDPQERRTVRRFLSLAGTEVNCAGGPTPWGSWLSCEECFESPGVETTRRGEVHRNERHGYIFEVPADAESVVDPLPLRAMGRFEHEAAAVDPDTGNVFLSEDKHRSLLYRFLPSVPGQLQRGGRLQALVLGEHPGHDTRNWEDPEAMLLNRWYAVEWIDLEDVDSETDDLRIRGHALGAARFARGEGLCYAQDSVFLTATIGGPERLGQIFELRIGRDGADALRLIAEATDSSLLRHADNLTMSAWGDLIVCEDTADHCGLVGVRPDGSQYALADNAYTDSELAGVCFSPDGTILFVNIQERGLTLAIEGPFPA